MVTKSWAPHVLNSTIASPLAPPTWKTIPDMALTCSGSEDKGDVGVQPTAADCLEATKKHGAARGKRGGKMKRGGEGERGGVCVSQASSKHCKHHRRFHGVRLVVVVPLAALGRDEGRGHSQAGDGGLEVTNLLSFDAGLGA